jgi:signal transduction histidine kinase
MIRALQGEASHLDDLELLVGNKRIPLEVFGTPVYDDSGEITYAIIAFQDISLAKHREAEQKKAEMQLQQTNEELIRANRLKDEFLATMSHELRTPLTAVLGMTQGLQEEVFGEINARQHKALQTIESSGSHLLSLINDILDLAKIGSGQINLDVAPIAVAPLCESSLLLIRPQAFQKNIQVESKLPTHLPKLLVDERRIRQVLINLLNNAVKFTPEGGYISLEISIPSLNTSPPFLRLAIQDTGIGISPENIDKLFQPFIQIDSALNRKYEGTGLGLALVKRIVELHGGQVGLTSTLGKGSCFTIDLPCTPVPTSIAPIESSSPTLDSSPDLLVPLSSPLILLVEDNKANSLTFSAYLQAKGYRLILAEDGATAIALAQSEQPDLILMDIQIPGMDGLEVIKHLRDDPQFLNKPIIALTALATDGDRDRCLAAGANNYLSKPVKMKELIVMIQQFL